MIYQGGAEGGRIAYINKCIYRWVDKSKKLSTHPNMLHPANSYNNNDAIYSYMC